MPPYWSAKYPRMWPISYKSCPGILIKERNLVLEKNTVKRYVQDSILRVCEMFSSSSCFGLPFPPLWPVDVTTCDYLGIILLIANLLLKVVEQRYQTEVNNEYVILGNSAILKCSIPSFLSDFVSVIAWQDDKGNVYHSIAAEPSSSRVNYGKCVKGKIEFVWGSHRGFLYLSKSFESKFANLLQSSNNHLCM